jgi:hypothetical protein
MKNMNFVVVTPCNSVEQDGTLRSQFRKNTQTHSYDDDISLLFLQNRHGGMLFYLRVSLFFSDARGKSRDITSS